MGPDTAPLGERHAHRRGSPGADRRHGGGAAGQGLPGGRAGRRRPITEVLGKGAAALKEQTMTSRREVLKMGAGLAAGAALGRAQAARPRTLLILGGTGFIGPHLTQEALRRGWKVTHFNRGKTRGRRRARGRDPHRRSQGTTGCAARPQVGRGGRRHRLHPEVRARCRHSCWRRTWVTACSSPASRPTRASPRRTTSTHRPASWRTPIPRRSPTTPTDR